MKKIAKISLVAAVAVAGLTTANAQQLEDAIKKVEVTGSVVYRYNDFNNDTTASTVNGKTTGTGGAENDVNTKNNGNDSFSDNNYKAALNLAAPVNDFVKLNTRFLVASATGDFAGPLDTSDSGDTNVNVALSNVYFGYTGIKNTTVNVGKQGLTTPWTVATQADGNEQTGTGALALSTLGNVTLAAAYFNQTNLGESGNGLPGILNAKKPVKGTTLTGDFNDTLAAWNSTNTANANAIGAEDIVTVGTIVAAGPVTLDAWYADLQETFDTFTIGAKTSTEVAGIKLGADARYTSLQLDRNVAERLYMTGSSYDNIDATNDTRNIHDDNSLAKLTLTASSGIYSGKAAYGKTGKEGGLTALDNDASTTLLGWGVTANNKADADFYQLVTAVDILPELNLSANYVAVDYTSDIGYDSKGVMTDKTSVKEQEIYAQLTYKMSKNLTSYVRYGVFAQDTAQHDVNRSNYEHVDAKGNPIASNVDSIDDTRGRIQVAYTF